MTETVSMLFGGGHSAQSAISIAPQDTVEKAVAVSTAGLSSLCKSVWRENRPRDSLSV